MDGRVISAIPICHNFDNFPLVILIINSNEENTLILTIFNLRLKNACRSSDLYGIYKQHDHFRQKVSLQ